MSLLLDALRRAGASRGDGFVEPVPDRRNDGPAAARSNRHEEDGAADVPSLDLDELTEGATSGDRADEQARGRARAEAVFRGGASSRSFLRLAGLGLIATLLGVGALLGGGWYYYETVRGEVDRELVRYTPERVPADMAGESSAEAGDVGGQPAPLEDTDKGADDGSAPDSPGGSTAGGVASNVAAEASDASAPGDAPDTGAGASATDSAPDNDGGGAETGAPQATEAGTGGDDTAREAASAQGALESAGGSGTKRGASDSSASDKAAAGASSTGGDDDASVTAATGSVNGTDAGSDTGEPMVRTSDTGGRLGNAIRSGYRALRSGELAAARRHYRQALTIAPANRDALLGAAAVALRWGDEAAAAEHYRRILEDNPRDPYARAGLASVDGNTDPRRSESELKSLLEDDPDAHALRFALGNLYAREGRWAAAQSAYFEAFRSAPKVADYAYNVAIALDHLGQRESAITYYDRALELAGDGSASFPLESATRRLESLRQ